MKNTVIKKGCLGIFLIAVCLVVVPAAHATINGITGTTFTLTAKSGHILAGDGDSIFMWGFAPASGIMQYPGPTLIVNQGDVVTVNLVNELPVPVSIVFPGHDVNAAGGTPGLITREAPPGGTVSYLFTATQPGTYMYYSGTRPELEVEMGLLGALIVRSGTANWAYNDPATVYNQEYLYLLSELDPAIHTLVEFGNMAAVDNTKFHPTAWFINGRNFPDTMGEPFVSWLPNQPYNVLPQTHIGDKVLIRMIDAGRVMHPLHTHGQNHLVIARDGRLLSDPANVTPTPDLAYSDYTTSPIAGETIDAIWGPWTGERLGWDIYGHTGAEPDICCPAPGPGCTADTIDANGFDVNTREYCADHGKTIPVALPDNNVLDFGPYFGGTPYLGVPGELPPLNPDGTVHTQLNPLAGLSYMWHSHNERELTTNNIFIGGAATLMLVMPPNVPIP